MAERKRKEGKPIALVVQCVVYVLPRSVEKLKLESSCRMQTYFISK
jgi:hypothetical protein